LTRSSFDTTALTARKNVCGVSVVDRDFEKLKRLNLAEIFDPTPKEVIQQASEGFPSSPGDPATGTANAAPEATMLRKEPSSMDLT